MVEPPTGVVVVFPVLVAIAPAAFCKAITTDCATPSLSAYVKVTGPATGVEVATVIFK